MQKPGESERVYMIVNADTDLPEHIEVTKLENGALGFAQNYDTAWGDAEGLNLQQRARRVSLM